MTISLTVLMEEEAINDKLRTGNVCTLAIKTDKHLTIINPGGKPTALTYNMSLLLNYSSENPIRIIITTHIPRYWTSLKEICKIFNIDSIIIPRSSRSSQRLTKYIEKILDKTDKKLKDSTLEEDIKIINIRSCTYSELIIIINGKIMISTPALWMLLPERYYQHVLEIIRRYKIHTYIGGFPLLPDIVKDHDIFIRKFLSNFRRIYLGNVRTRSSREALDRFPIEVRILRVGLEVQLDT